MDIRRVIREEIEKVLNPPPEVIQIDVDEGSIHGVVHFDRQHLNNWVEKERIQPNFDTIPDDELFPIGILKNIEVNEEFRGQGVGSELFDRFMVECSHCSYVVLIADTGESNNFNIIDWYKRKGFTIFGESGGMPVMIKKAGSLEEIDLSINSSPRAKPGIVRQFPQAKEAGNTLNISSSGAPYMFPEEDDLK